MFKKVDSSLYSPSSNFWTNTSKANLAFSEYVLSI